ncbi:hypothetical protein ACFQZ4_10540 [Catellatospora coxensis]
MAVTATGRPASIPAPLLGQAKDGCILLNAGHSDDEIEVTALGPARPVLPHLTAHRYGDRELFLFAAGRIANLVAGDGDSLNVFDTTAALMTASLGWTITEGSTYPPGLHPLPTTAWRPATPDPHPSPRRSCVDCGDDTLESDIRATVRARSSRSWGW